jgi:hypothetical protein
MTVIGPTLLLAVGRALAQIHVEHDRLRQSPLVYLVDPVAGQIGERGKVRFSGRLSHFVSKRPIWLAEAAHPMIARPPTTRRIAGSRLSLSASFTSLLAFACYRSVVICGTKVTSGWWS